MSSRLLPSVRVPFPSSRSSQSNQDKRHHGSVLATVLNTALGQHRCLCAQSRIAASARHGTKRDLVMTPADED